jgi:predicted phage-related endonuclease
MQRGTDLEPIARKKYEEVYYTKTEQMCLLHPEYHWMRTSLDGITVDRKYTLEIKCPKDLANHKRQTKDGKVPRHRRAQIQHQLAVCNAHFGTEVAHYWSYVDDNNYKLIEVRIDHEYIAELIRRERIFLDYVERNERPPFNLFREGHGLIARVNE